MKRRAPRNRTLTCAPEEKARLAAKILYPDELARTGSVGGRIICGDTFEVAENLPRGFIDLLVLDPPYNLSKNYGDRLFKEKGKADYREWFERALALLTPTLKPTASVYVCSDWKTSTLIAPFLGSGTTAAVAKKPGRNYCGIEINEEYCCWALKRLEMADSDQKIQGYADGVFWERNSLADQPRTEQPPSRREKLAL